MNAPKANTSLGRLIFTVAILFSLNSAQAHPGHSHDGGLTHLAAHGVGWMAGILVVASVWWIRRPAARGDRRLRAE